MRGRGRTRETPADARETGALQTMSSLINKAKEALHSHSESVWSALLHRVTDGNGEQNRQQERLELVVRLQLELELQQQLDFDDNDYG